jgi:hypothetical protein
MDGWMDGLGCTEEFHGVYDAWRREREVCGLAITLDLILDLVGPGNDWRNV